MADRILIFDVAGDSMGGGSWKDQVICTRRKDGTFSLRARKSGDDGLDIAPAGVTRIRSPERFARVLTEMFKLLGYEFDSEELSEEICDAVAKVDWDFAIKLKSYLSSTIALA